MYQEERWIAILHYLQEHGRISTDEICERYQVSRDTARRDLVKLEEEKKIVRTHGGAILPTLTKDVPVYAERLNAETGPKQAIGQLASTLIQDGDYVLMDSSTTVRWAAEYMKSKHNIVVTNSVDVGTTLSDKPDVTVHLLGGVLRSEQRSVYGARAVAMLADYQVDRLLIGTCGITLDGLSSPYEEEGFLTREMIRRADQVIVLADHSKFGKRLFHRFASLAEIDAIVTDRLPAPELLEALEHYHVDIMLTQQGGTNHD